MANGSASGRITTGSVNYAGGVNGGIVPVIASQNNPHGLKPDQLAWLGNGTVRGGSIAPRPAYAKLAAFALDIGILQEAKEYKPDVGFPYIIAQIGGRTFIVRVDSDNSIQEVTIPGDPNPSDITQAWMCQAEQFMVIQDGISVPLVWDGTTLQRVTSMLNQSPKIPTAEAMDYYQGRLWLAKGREVIGSDIVRGPSGTGTLGPPPTGYGLRDSVLSVKENTYEANGGTITMPNMGGNIRALSHTANIDTALGEGQLYAFTREQIYSINVVPTRAEWILQTEPIVKVANINYGTTSDRSIVKSNGDLFFQSMLGVNSFAVSVRNNYQWGQTPISKEETRVIQFNNRELLRFGSGIEFNNRCLQTVLPIQTPVGVAHLGIMPLDFDVISTLTEKLPPVWEGMWEGLDFLRLLQGDYGGLQKAFSLVHSRLTGGIEVWQITSNGLFDEGDKRISWAVEFPSYTWGDAFQLKELDTFELWIDQLYGTVEIEAEYREGQTQCWHRWKEWKECAARNECELPGIPEPCDYPSQPYSQQYRATLVAPKAPAECDATNGRASNISYMFQIRLKIKGSMRIRGIIVHALPKTKAPYEGIVC